MNTENSSKDIGDKFQRDTKYYPGKLPRHFLDFDNKPELYKTYENPLEVISLPDPEFGNKAKLLPGEYGRIPDSPLQKRGKRRATEAEG